MKIDDHIIFQNNEIVAINKPAGLLTIPDREGKEPTLKGILKQKFGEIFYRTPSRQRNKRGCGFLQKMKNRISSYLPCSKEET